MARSLLVLLHAGDWERRWMATSLALTAAAHGDAVRVALFGDALRDWMSGRFDRGAPAPAAAARVGSLAEMLEEGRRELGLRLVACDTAVRLAGVDLAEAAGRIEVTSLPALWREARDGQVLAV